MGSVNNGPRPGYPPPRRKLNDNQLAAAKLNNIVGGANRAYQDGMRIGQPAKNKK